MARSQLATQQTVAAGLNATYTAANAAGHFIAGTGRVLLHVKNGGGSSINVTLETPGQVDGLDIADQVVAVPAGGERFIGPFSQRTYDRPAGAADAGKVYVDFSGVTSVTIAALEV